MIIKVTYPLEKEKKVDLFEIEHGDLGIGDIVVVEGLSKGKEYGVVIKLNVPLNRELNKNNVNLVGELDRVLFWTSLETFLLKNGVKLNSNSLDKYRETNENSELTDNEINTKMTRNLLLCHRPYKIPISKNGQLVLNYGCLRIVYNKGKIYNLDNRCKVPIGWVKDIEKYNHYSKLLGIEGM